MKIGLLVSCIIPLSFAAIEHKHAKKLFVPYDERVAVECHEDYKSKNISRVEWFDQFGTRLWSGNYLTLQLTLNLKYLMVICDSFDHEGKVISQTNYFIQPYVAPVIFINFIYSASRNDLSLHDMEDAAFEICRGSEYCRTTVVFEAGSSVDKVRTVSNNTRMLYIARKEDEQAKIFAVFGVNLCHKLFMKSSDVDIMESIKETVIPSIKTNVSAMFSGRRTRTDIEAICRGGYYLRTIWRSYNPHPIHRCVPCGPGSSAKVRANECVSCAVGYFQPAHAKVSCIPCPVLYTTRGRNSTSIKDCIVDANLWGYTFMKAVDAFWLLFRSSEIKERFNIFAMVFVYVFVIFYSIGKIIYRIILYRRVKQKYKAIERRIIHLCTLAQLHMINVESANEFFRQDLENPLFMEEQRY